MITFKEFIQIAEDLWYTSGPQDNPQNPGTKRRNEVGLWNKRYGNGTGGQALQANPAPGAGAPANTGAFIK